MQNIFDNAKMDARLPKSDQLYEHLRAAIISMKLVPGEPLPEKELCAHFGVSKTPFRDALKKLVDESLVTVVPSGGTFVNKMVLREVLEGQMVRETLEVKMVRLAARNYNPSFDKKFELQLFTQELAARNPNVDEFFALDNEFHRLICLCAGFPKIWQTIHYATGQLDRVRRHSYTMRSHFDDVLKEHQEIYASIKAGDEAAAAAAFQIQLDTVIPVFEQLRQEASDIIDDSAGIRVEQIR